VTSGDGSGIRRNEAPLIPRRTLARPHCGGARAALAHDNGGGRVTDPYIPARIRVGARPSVYNCFGCPEVANRPYQRGMLRICGVSGTTFRQTLQCPKMTTRPGSAQIIQEAIISDYY
jgi:hypothetical protein